MKEDDRYEAARSDVLELIFDTNSGEEEEIDACSDQLSKEESAESGSVDRTSNPEEKESFRPPGGHKHPAPAATKQEPLSPGKAVIKRQYSPGTCAQASHEPSLHRTEATFLQPGAHAVRGICGSESREAIVDQESNRFGMVERDESVGYTESGGMALAVLVTGEELFQEATPVPPSEQAPSQAQFQEKTARMSSNPVRIVAAALGAILILVFGLVLGVSFRKKTFGNGPVLPDLPVCTRAALRDPTSPQSLAYEWLSIDPLLESYPLWRKHQRFALATFYFSTGGEGWDLQENWLDPEMPECEWFFRKIVGSPKEIGVFGDQVTNYQVEYAESACDEEGHYKVLVFPKNNLVGTIPPELSLLSSSLEVLRVSENELGGPIPTEVGMLTNLKRLYLEANSLTGYLPSQIGLLHQLQELDISYNPFCGIIPTQLGKLGDSLKVLSIKRSGVKGMLPTELYLLSNLESLFILGNEDLTDASLTPNIANMKKLQRLVVCQAPYAGPIPSELGLLTDLWEVNFWNTSLTGTIPSEVWKLSKMTYLDLASNLLSGTFPAELSAFSGLKQTYLERNLFSSHIPGEIFSNLGQMTLLKISDNLISGSIPTQVGFLTSMERMMLNYNSLLTGTIPSEIANLSNLQELLLHDTSISGTLPAELASLSSLELLVVANTSLTGSIPNDLCSRVVDYEYECYWHLGLFEICWDKLKPTSFTCNHSKLCGCQCGTCG